MAFENLSEVTIRQNCLPQSYQRGAEYCRSGAVESLTQRGNTLQAEVEGSADNYQVTAIFAPDGFIDAACSCPYDYEGWCKHIVAALLACLKSPGDIDEQPPLQELLAPLTREQLLALVLDLAEHDADLADGIAAAVPRLAASVSGVAASGAAIVAATASPVNPAIYRRQVKNLLKNLEDGRYSDSYWQPSQTVKAMDKILDEVSGFIAAHDGSNALLVLEAITDEYLQEWDVLYEMDDEAGAVIGDLGKLWTEALLTADLYAKERAQWAKQLEKWQKSLRDYDMADDFQAAIVAAREGWEHPPLQQILQGESKSSQWFTGEVIGEYVEYADALTVARLNVLERQKRFEEYLRLAAAEDQTLAYGTMLAKLGRAQEALDYGLEYFARVDEFFAIAQALHQQGSVEPALQLAEHGLALPGEDTYYRGANGNLNKAALAVWLRDLATAQGQTARALSAARIAVLESPSLDAYLKTRELAGKAWPQEREKLLQQLRQMKLYDPAGAVDIFLHEAKSDESFLDLALDKVQGSHDYDLVGRVVEAAIASQPQRVIPICRQQAAAIMDAGQAPAYEYAALWLQRMRSAHQAAGQEEQWQAYLEPLIAKHQKKWKLRPLLEALR